MKYDVIVIAGTTESREVIVRQLKEKKKILACVATKLGAEMLADYDIDIHAGRLDEDGFVKLFTENPCGKIVDATHPFARIVTETVRAAAARLQIPYERYERQELTYDYERLFSVADAGEAAAWLNERDGNVLLTTGVNTASLYMERVKDARERLFIRVLDNESSLEGCRKAGYPDEHVFGKMPPFTVEDNLRLIRETKASVMVSKDSGKTGGVDVKVEACRRAGIDFLLIRRPAPKMPRVLLAGANSGCGKTSVTCGILKALTDRGVKIQSYKCGPDYIDPMLHGHITGRDCRNLDPFFSTGEELRSLVAKDSRQVEFSVAEGVMGYYDGVGVTCEKSTYTVSEETKTPTILIINGKGMSHTMIPLIKGLAEYRDNPVRGVILNRCSRPMYERMKPLIEEELGILVVGYFPENKDAHIGSRHLGLMTAAEIENLDEVISLLGKMAEESIDLDLLMKIGREAPALPDKMEKEIQKEKGQKERIKIAVAWDKAFCFYYAQNLDILREKGADLVYFSPVEDERLPEDVSGIYIGGGYPETYRKELSENLSMKASIHQAAESGMPILAECGGFMYTCENLIETDGTSVPMLGLVPTDVEMTRKLSGEFGYVTMEALKDTPFFKKGTKIRAHEFHYSKAAERGDVCLMSKTTGRNWQGVYSVGNLLAGYPHLYFHNCPQVAESFVRLAEEYKGTCE
ncbi:MAG: cobyrinate a,c-diamide synthase [Eubacteriales bacterium]|nr:cobyrinate a,c-diamide synthase [Eubacteriales bacterium]